MAPATRCGTSGVLGGPGCASTTPPARATGAAGASGAALTGAPAAGGGGALTTGRTEGSRGGVEGTCPPMAGGGAATGPAEPGSGGGATGFATGGAGFGTAGTDGAFVSGAWTTLGGGIIAFRAAFLISSIVRVRGCCNSALIMSGSLFASATAMGSLLTTGGGADGGGGGGAAATATSTVSPASLKARKCSRTLSASSSSNALE